MAKISIHDEHLVLDVQGVDKLWTLTSRLRIPLGHVRGATVDPGIAREPKGWRGPGAHVPGVIVAGTFHHHDEKIFWDVHDPSKTVVIELEDETYQQLVIEVDDPRATVALIERTVATHTLAHVNHPSAGAGLVEALHAPGPAPAQADRLGLFGQFVGSWDLHWSGHDTSGQPAQMTGELHAGWVLGGRAVQDVWIVPGRGQPGEGHAPGFHGTTIRFYDPAIDAWRSTWIDPPNARVRRFIARPADEGIELLSNDDDPHLRWRFTDITGQSFRWIGEVSTDHGTTWQRHQEMRASRR